MAWRRCRPHQHAIAAIGAGPRLGTCHIDGEERHNWALQSGHVGRLPLPALNNAQRSMHST